MKKIVKLLVGKINNLSDAKKSAIVFVFASALTSGLNIITTPVFTRIMPVEDYGIVSLYGSWHQMLNVIATFSVTNSVINVGFHNYTNDRKGFLSSALGVSTFFSVAVIAFIMLTLKWFCEISGLNISLVVLLATSFCFLTATQLWLCLQRYEYNYKVAFWLITGSACISTILSVVLVLLSSKHYAEVKLYATNTIPIIIGAFFYVSIILHGKKFYNKKYWSFILAFNAPLIIHYFSQFILAGSDRIMIGYYQDEVAVAIYSLGYTIANILLIFWNPVNSSIVPFIHDCIDNNDTVRLKNCFYLVLGVAGLLCMGVSLIAPEIVSILGGKSYTSAMYIVPPVLVGIFFTVFYSMTANIEFLYGKTHRIALMTIFAAILNVVLNAILIPNFGAIAAAYTTLISYVVYSVLHFLNMKRLYKVKFVSGAKISALMTTITVTCLSCALLYNTGIIRYIFVIFLFCLLLILYKKGLFSKIIKRI